MNEMQTILLADDSENDLLLMSHAFEKAGFKTQLKTVHNGEEAIAYLKGERGYSDRSAYPLPNVVLLDLNMPKKSGFDVLEWVRAQAAFKHVPIVVLTASTRIEDVERAYELGASSFLVKPAAIHELVAMIRCLCEWLQFNHFPPLNTAVRR